MVEKQLKITLLKEFICSEMYLSFYWQNHYEIIIKIILREGAWDILGSVLADAQVVSL